MSLLTPPLRDVEREIEAGISRLGLPPRQAAVARAVVTGATLAEVAAALGLTRETVKHYLALVYQRTGARTDVQLLRVLLGASPTFPVREAG